MCLRRLDVTKAIHIVMVIASIAYCASDLQFQAEEVSFPQPKVHDDWDDETLLGLIPARGLETETRPLQLGYLTDEGQSSSSSWWNRGRSGNWWDRSDGCDQGVWVALVHSGIAGSRPTCIAYCYGASYTLVKV